MTQPDRKAVVELLEGRRSGGPDTGVGAERVDIELRGVGNGPCARSRMMSPSRT